MACDEISKKNYTVIFGYSREIKYNLISDFQPDACFIGGTSLHDLFEKVSESNCLVISLNEEGGLFISDQDIVNKLEKEDLHDYVDMVFLWGNQQAKIIRDNTDFDTNSIFVTGNPRFDLLQPKLRKIYKNQSKSIVDKYGDYILFNTNFIWANNNKNSLRMELKHTESLDTDVYIKENLIPKAKKEKLEIPHVEYELELMSEFISAINVLSREIDENIVIRPHPSNENHNVYKNEFRGNEKVSISQNGDARSWIFGSNAVIHNGCTTGIESALLNKPVISYQPSIHVGKANRKSLPNELSIIATSVEGLINKTQKHKSKSMSYHISKKKKKILKKRLSNIDHLSAPIIVDLVDDNLPKETIYSDINMEKSHVAIISDLVQKYATYIKKRSPMRKSANQKFPGLSVDELETLISELEPITGVSNEDISINHSKNCDNVYLMQNSEIR